MGNCLAERLLRALLLFLFFFLVLLGVLCFENGRHDISVFWSGNGQQDRVGFADYIMKRERSYERVHFVEEYLCNQNEVTGMCFQSHCLKRSSDD